MMLRMRLDAVTHHEGTSYFLIEGVDLSLEGVVLQLRAEISNIRGVEVISQD